MDFLGRARKAMKGLGPQEPAKPQYYRVACPEGHVLRGLRTEGYQALRCPTCGEGIFVLPRSPLPEPPIPHVERPKSRPSSLPQAVAEGPITLSDPPPGASTTVEAEIEWDEPELDAGTDAEVDFEGEPETPPARPASPRPRPQEKKAAAPARPAPKPRPAAREAEPEFEPEMPRERFADRLRRHRHALIIGGVLLLVAGTFGIRMLRQRRQNLPQIAEASRIAGFEALEASEFDVAKKKLDEAADALEDLGDDEAPTVRQAADEAAVLADLASASLEEIVEEVATKSDGSSRFASLHKGRSVLIDARIDEGRAGGAPEIDYRIFVGSGPLAKTGRLDLAGFQLLEGRKPGDRVTFGARLASVSLEEDKLWHVRFEPKSGVYVRSPQAWKALATLGWEPTTAESEAAP